MANSKGSTNFRNVMYSGKHALLPPKSPFPSVSPPYADYVFTPAVGQKAVQKPRDGNAHHQRTSSESLIAEEQPSWFDDLLNEPETPVRRGGHRRSSSDSFAYVDNFNLSNLDYGTQDDYKFRNLVSAQSWGSQDFDHHKDLRHGPFYAEMNLAKQKNRAWEPSLNAGNPKDTLVRHGSGSFCMSPESDGLPSTAEKYEGLENFPHDLKASEKKDCSSSKASSSDSDTKRAKQQFAQRSRVRKLQYIAELERNVQVLQVEGSEVSAELEFLNQQNLILSMENKTLKQRLESLAQEHLIKHLEHEVLEREIGRLRTVYRQQMQPPQQALPSSHRRSNSRELDSQFSNLSLKHKEANPGRDPSSGQLRI